MFKSYRRKGGLRGRQGFSEQVAYNRIAAAGEAVDIKTEGVDSLCLFECYGGNRPFYMIK